MVVGPFASQILTTRFGRARRHEDFKDQFVVDICETITSLSEECIEFWGKDAEALGERNQILMATINARLHRINGLFLHVFDDGSAELSNSRRDWKKAHRAASGGEMFDDDRKADANRLTAILKHCWDLEREVRSRRERLSRKWMSDR